MATLKRMDYELLVKIFRKIAQNYATESALDDVEQRIDDIVSEGGEPNVITSVKQNGVALEVVDKAVDVTVPTKVSELENDSGYQTEEEIEAEIAVQIAEIVAGAPESLDTLKEIADWIEGHAADAAEMNSEIKANTEDLEELAELIGTLPEGAAATTIVEYITEVVDDAVGDIDFSAYLTEADFEEFTDEEIEAAYQEAISS